MSEDDEKLRVEVSDEGVKLRAEIDNRAFTAIQTACGGAVLLAASAIPDLLKDSPEFIRPLSIFIGLNALAFLISMVGVLVRRETSRKFSVAWANKNDLEKYKIKNKEAWKWSNIMWALIITSVLIITISYVSASIYLFNVDVPIVGTREDVPLGQPNQSISPSSGACP